jgi:hypothetical protein
MMIKLFLLDIAHINKPLITMTAKPVSIGYCARKEKTLFTMTLNISCCIMQVTTSHYLPWTLKFFNQILHTATSHQLP